MERNIEFVAYTDVSGGLQLNSNPFGLEINQSPYMVNTDITNKGFFPRGGYQFQKALPDWVNITEIFDYYYKGEYSWIAVSYPYILKINPYNFSYSVLYKKWYSNGKPRAAQSPTTIMLVDGINKPLQITGNTVVEVAWPQQLTNDNNDAGAPGELGNIVNSPFSTRADQRPADFGPINNVLYINDRFQVTETKYGNIVIFSRWDDYTDFATNAPADYDIAFFVQLPTPYPVTGWEVLNNEYVVIYLTNGYIVQSGKQPPGEGYQEPLLSWSVRDSINGCISNNLIQKNSDGDQFYITSRNRVFTLKSSENFNQAKTEGLSEDISIALKKYTKSMWEKTFFINNHTEGELLMFTPKDQHDGYMQQCFVYKYSGSIPSWTYESDWGSSFRMTCAHLNLETGQVFVVNQGNRICLVGKGTRFDTEPVRTVVELRPELFNNPVANKEVLGVMLAVTNYTSGTIYYRAKWDSGEETLEKFNFTDKVSLEDLREYLNNTESNILSDIGKPLEILFKPIKNKNGQILRQRIETVNEQDVGINLIAVVYRENNLAPYAKKQ
jgi:hypothetical protein